MQSSSQLSYHKPIPEIRKAWKMPSHSIIDWLDCIIIKNGDIFECRKKWEQRQFERREKLFVEPTFETMEAFEKKLKMFNILHDRFLTHYWQEEMWDD